MKRNVIIIVAVFVILLIIGVAIYNNSKRKYNIEKVTDFKYYVLIKEEKIGVIDKEGNIIINPEYYSIEIPNPSKPVFICAYDYNSETDEYKTKVVNNKNEQIFKNYEEVRAIELKEIVSDIPYEKSVLKIKKNNKYGLIDFSGKIIVKPIYDKIDNMPYKEGELLVKKDNKYGIINIKGTKMVDIQYEEISSDNYYDSKNEYKLSGYIVSKKTEEGYRYGYISNKGKNILKLEYNKLYRVTEIEDDKSVYLVAEKDGKAGILKNNKIILNYQYQNVEYEVLNGVFIIEKDNKYGVVDKLGKSIIDINYEKVSIEGNNIYASINGKDLIFNIKGEQQESVKFKNIIKTSNEKYFITIDSNYNYGVQDKDGNIIIPSNYSYIDYIYKDYFIVSNSDGQSGIINNEDKVIIDIKYDVIQKISNLDVIETIESNNDNIQLYDVNLNKIISMKNAKISLTPNYIKLYSNTETKFFNLKGQEQKANQIFLNHNLYAQQKDERWGFVDKDGNVKVNYIYDKVTEINQYGFAGIRKGNKWGVINSKGDIILEPTYVLNDKLGEPEFIGKYYKVVSEHGEIHYTDEMNIE